MRYLPIELGFRQHPKTRRFREKIGSDVGEVYLVRLWEWAMVYAPDGDLSRFSSEDLADAVGLTREAADTFYSALDGCGFLEADGNLHGWNEKGRGGWINTQRCQDAERKRLMRASENVHRTNPPRPKTSRKVSEVEVSREDQNHTPPRHKSGAREDVFATFWMLYPKKVGKGAASRAWKAIKEKPTALALKTALDWQCSSDQWTKDAGQYVPNPSTYLNQARWLDEPQANGKSIYDAILARGGEDYRPPYDPNAPPNIELVRSK